MEKNEIKKWLYKNKPEARLTKIKNGKAIYITMIDGENTVIEIPVKDMETGEFVLEMDAHLLIRWL